MKELIKLNEKEFHKEVISLLQIASQPPRFEYQIAAKPQVLGALRQVISRLEWESDIETHPNRSIRRGILGGIENRCPIDTSLVSNFEIS